MITILYSIVSDLSSMIDFGFSPSLGHNVNAEMIYSSAYYSIDRPLTRVLF